MNREEFAALAVEYLGQVTAYARRLTRNAADADDLVQDTYDRAFQQWKGLCEPRACRAWLGRIARNLCESISPDEALALGTLLAGYTLGRVSELLGTRGSDPAAVSTWFARWMRNGLVVDCTFDRYNGGETGTRSSVANACWRCS